MENLQSLSKSLQELEALAGDKKKAKRFTKSQILSLIARHYGYQAYLDAVDNKMTGKTMLALLDQIRRDRMNRVIELATADRVAQADKKDFQKIIKQWSKEAEK